MIIIGRMFRCALVLVLAGCSQMSVPMDANPTMGTVTWDVSSSSLGDPPARSLPAQCSFSTAGSFTTVRFQASDNTASVLASLVYDPVNGGFGRGGAQSLTLTDGPVYVNEMLNGSVMDACTPSGTAMIGPTVSADITITCPAIPSRDTVWQAPMHVQIAGCARFP